MALLIKGGRIITATDDFVGDVYCAGETITRVAARIEEGSLKGAGDLEVIDATGKYVFPGFIDPHVHIHLPFMGTLAKDDWASASRAALLGGTTTLLEMVCPAPDAAPLGAFEEWRGKADGRAAVDYGFHMGVVRFDDEAKGQLERIATEFGNPSFKVFLAYKGALNISDEDLFETLSLAKRLGVVVTAHCENADLIAAMQARLIGEGKTGPEWHEPSRPVEVVAPHLALDRSYAEQKGFEGAKYVMSPPLREAGNIDAMWRGIRAGHVATIGTDHAPFDFKGQKEMGREDFTKIPNGIPSVQERVVLAHELGVRRGRIDLQTMVAACSTNAARMFGLYPRKGTIREGADGDLVVFDPERRVTLSKSWSASKVDYCAFEGWEVAGTPTHVAVRGALQVRDGEFVGEIGRGRFLRRETSRR